jgi:hypothetical protein
MYSWGLPKPEAFMRMMIRLIAYFACLSWLAVVLMACAQPSFAQTIREFHRVFPVNLAEPLALQVDLSEGDLQIAYAREGQVSISAMAQIPAGMNVEEDFLTTRLSVETVGNRLEIRSESHAADPREIKIAYRVDVPYRTEVHSVLDHGNQSITGIIGPVRAEGNQGDIKVSYVSQSITAQTGTGNLDLQVIGGQVEARTGRGNILCSRAAQGVSAGTGEGDISLMVVGPSTATVKGGTGRIDAGGVRGTLVASTDAGDLHVKAVLHDDWQLTSVSGSIRVELPPAARFDIDVSTNSGEVLINRDDLEKPAAGIHQFHQRVNGGGKHVVACTESGRVVIS